MNLLRALIAYIKLGLAELLVPPCPEGCAGCRERRAARREIEARRRARRIARLGRRRRRRLSA